MRSEWPQACLAARCANKGNYGGNGRGSPYRAFRRLQGAPPCRAAGGVRSGTPTSAMIVQFAYYAKSVRNARTKAKGLL
jgi:hypothetical protein